MSSLKWLLALPFLTLIALLLPILAWNSYRQTSKDPVGDEDLPTMGSLAGQTVVVQVIIFGLAWLAKDALAVEVSWRSVIGFVPLLVTASVVALGLFFAWSDSRRPTDSSNVLGRLLERASPFQTGLLAMVLAAGVAEEFAYRGVLTGLLTSSIGASAAWIASSVLFAFGHFAQGWRGFVASAAFALALQGVVFFSGGLSLAIAAHIIYDLAAIWFSQHLAKRRKQA